MIVPRTPWQAETVSGHYDELDTLYREIWGEHLHHGFWERGEERAEEATIKLLERVAERARLAPHLNVCDAGCGYGATARWLAATYGTEVTGVTLSPAQYRYAQAQPAVPDVPRPTYLLHDWLTNPLADASFDVVTMLESTEHMPDLNRALAQARRVLRPGGRIVICAWLAADTPRAWEVRHLLEPICREGRLAGLGTMQEYVQALEAAGFKVERADDITGKVQRTWAVILGRVLRGLATKPDYWRYLLNAKHRERPFALSLVRMGVAYRIGALRYGLINAVK